MSRSGGVVFLFCAIMFKNEVGEVENAKRLII